MLFIEHLLGAIINPHFMDEEREAQSEGSNQGCPKARALSSPCSALLFLTGTQASYCAWGLGSCSLQNR